MIARTLLLPLALCLALVGPAGADDGRCVEPLEVTQQWVGRQLMTSVVFELQSPGSTYVCPMLAENMGGTRFVLRRQLPPRLELPDPVIDSCVSFIDQGTHPVDGFARVQVRDTAGSFQCVVGPDAEGAWHVTPARTQYYRASWYQTP